MGGKEASRGFVYQGLASVLEALCKNGWEKIFVEFPTSGDKVDIAFENNEKIIKAIQVKSTINSFSKKSIIQWLTELKNDVLSPEYELFLIGQCDKEANVFINAVDKYQNKQLDKMAEGALQKFDTTLIDNCLISFKILPFDVMSLEKITSASLHNYTSSKGHNLIYDQIAFIASATLTDYMLLSTQGSSVNKEEFDNKLEKRILLMAHDYLPKRITLGIRSFSRGAENMADETQSMLCLTEKFEGRVLKKEFDWEQDILASLQEFLRNNTDCEQAYELLLDTHMSVAFSAGRILDTKIGINIFPIQKTAKEGSVLWDTTSLDRNEYPDWDIKNEFLQNDYKDSVLVLNLTRNIHKDVMEFISDKNISVNRIINCTLKNYEANNISIVNGTHATKLANSLYTAIIERSITERQATLHIFSAAPNAFMFFLGQVSRGFGKCIIYEFDFEQIDNCSYKPSISFIN